MYFFNDTIMLSYFQNGLSAALQESMLSGWYYGSSPYKIFNLSHTYARRKESPMSLVH